MKTLNILYYVCLARSSSYTKSNESNIFEGGKTQVFIKYISSNIFIIDQNLSVFEGYRKFNNMFVFVRDYFWPEEISVLKYKHNLFLKDIFNQSKCKHL